MYKLIRIYSNKPGIKIALTSERYLALNRWWNRLEGYNRNRLFTLFSNCNGFEEKKISISVLESQIRSIINITCCFVGV